MAVVAMWKCDRDDSMFDNKKDADAYDKMLELAESFTQFLEKHAAGISEQDAETIGLLLSKNKEQLIAACKGKPEVLLSLGEGDSEADSNVTELSAAG
ncbi:YebG family protein [Dasania sp. GY-MA-18]|uniref:YebG family protein n=1 Tax=Dasania phycosphaerae TaxID=2950436 RepID=A0A9J6RM19_9GAMM|nr:MULTISPECIES: YebG family protein [Dasania]MCR8923131.1 YebG family protein [Dasania sp. GY-MA-18]MCZ0865563.1 YebG family protein [Dasania phycosphaerae]MCZ0869288.1 YebG family protein [Dasania phycosphaerae]